LGGIRFDWAWGRSVKAGGVETGNNGKGEGGSAKGALPVAGGGGEGEEAKQQIIIAGEEKSRAGGEACLPLLYYYISPTIYFLAFRYYLLPPPENKCNPEIQNFQPVRLAYQPPASSTFLSQQTSHLLSNQSAVLFSQNKPAPAISHQPNEQDVCHPKKIRF
jgi:hypothetical protein